MEVFLKYDSPPLRPKAHWKKRHHKKNYIKVARDIVRVLAEEIRKEIDVSVITQLIRTSSLPL
jgi:hypothetical protein